MEETIMRLPTFNRARATLALASSCAIAALVAGGAARAAEAVVVPGSTDFPESMSASSDGTLYFSSFAGARIWRAKPGEATATEFVKQGSNGLSSALGVLADDKSNTLYVCSDDTSGFGLTLPTGDTPTSLKLYDLKTGEPKGSVPLPGKGPLCNDIVAGADGNAYVTDSFGAQILRLKPGAKEFEVWAHDPRWDVQGKPQLDGIAQTPDGAIYANLFEGDGLYRVTMNADGSAGTITKLQTSRPLYHSDGLRAFGPNKLIQVEGETKGDLDLITVDGDNAKIETIKDGFDGPVSLAQVGDQIYVLDVPLRYLLGPEAKAKKAPPPFKATPVPAPAQ
jgi:sugar lactone lactonase YvrE